MTDILNLNTGDRTMKRYSAWGHDGSFRFKWQRDLWVLINNIRANFKK